MRSLDIARTDALNPSMTPEQRASDCWERADEAYRRAMQETTPAKRQYWRDLEQTWARMARALEDAAKLDACLGAAIDEYSESYAADEPVMAPVAVTETVEASSSDRV
jgi:hypothetical protein